MGMQLQGISVIVRGIWVEMQKMWGIRVTMQEINVETVGCGKV